MGSKAGVVRNKTEQISDVGGVDQTIAHVERLYQSVTGHDAPPITEPYAPIPPEVDAAHHVEAQFNQLLGMLGEPVARATWMPPVTVWQQDDELVCEFDIPGVTRDAIELRATDRALTVTGNRNPAWRTANHAHAQLCEQSHGVFLRTITLPTDVLAAQMSARLCDGVLQVRMPRAPTASQQRAIPIE